MLLCRLVEDDVGRLVIRLRWPGSVRAIGVEVTVLNANHAIIAADKLTA